MVVVVTHQTDKAGNKRYYRVLKDGRRKRITKAKYDKLRQKSTTWLTKNKKKR